MHTVERLELALAEAESRGFLIRHDWFNGATSSTCELKGKRWLFVDLSLSPEEQLAQVLDALAEVEERPAAKNPSQDKLRKAA